jgi:hypothetical protein
VTVTLAYGSNSGLVHFCRRVAFKTGEKANGAGDGAEGLDSKDPMAPGRRRRRRGAGRG